MLEALFGGVASFVLRIAKPVFNAVVKAVLNELNITTREVRPASEHEKTAKNIDEEISAMERSAARAGRMSARDQDQLLSRRHPLSGKAVAVAEGKDLDRIHAVWIYGIARGVQPLHLPAPRRPNLAHASRASPLSVLHTR